MVGRSRRLRGTSGSPWCGGEGVQHSGPSAATVGGLCFVLDTWATGLESSCTLLKGALPRHETASASRGFSVNWHARTTHGPGRGLMLRRFP